MIIGSENIQTSLQLFPFFYSIVDVCGFDSGSCGFKNDVSHDGRWDLERGTQHQVDHTYGTENGEQKSRKEVEKSASASFLTKL